MAAPSAHLRAKPWAWGPVMGEGHAGGRAATPRKGRKEPGPGRIKDTKGKDRFKEELGRNPAVECSLAIMQNVNSGEVDRLGGHQ